MGSRFALTAWGRTSMAGRGVVKAREDADSDGALTEDEQEDLGGMPIEDPGKENEGDGGQ